ncbi:hypothetical protein G7054_g13734 [Neopestalotiopsis clavispora]|nr:hypothetical protein G7054_g13734 [Neopestalotiopsis clavispora]
MARLHQAPMTPRRSVSNPDSFTDLNRLLARLQQSILHADADREHRLRTSEYERNKASINLEYARTLLTKLEQEALSIKIHNRRQETQADLNRKRYVFDQITERLAELEETSIDSDEDDDSDGEDILGAIQTPSESLESTNSEQPIQAWTDAEEEEIEQNEQDAEGESYADESTIVPEPRRNIQPDPVATREPQPSKQDTPVTRSADQQGTSTQQSLRSRGAAPATQTHNDSAETTARSQLFGNKHSSPTTALSTSATTEAILDHQRAEQDKLTESLLSMARTLKSQSHAFQSDLETEKDVLAAAGAGMEKGERGMDAASRRMGTLRKMTEGKGWWGRMMLYAWIFGLMVIAILIVGVMPKLRF